LQPTTHDHVIGAGDRAAVTLVTYGDYECPFTARGVQLTSLLLDELGDGLRYLFRHFPLTDKHPHALAAACAAEAAARQNRFWEMHAMLIRHQRALGEQALFAYAAELRLDRARFARDLVDPEVARHVLADHAGGEAMGVRSTPTFFVNGMKYDGPVDGIRALVEEVANAVGAP
jgi:protein-disulfide isomerase